MSAKKFFQIILLPFIFSQYDDYSLYLKVAYAKAEAFDKPFFSDNPQNVTVEINDTAILKCTVQSKGNRTISWIRKHDLAILTSNTFVYTTDARFSVIHILESNNWDLRIKPANLKDSGLYECQVNTEPKINFPVFLDVINDVDITDDGKEKAINRFDGRVPKAKIIGPAVIQVQKGSTIALTCSIDLQASFILWYHNATVVDYTRGGINLENEKSSDGMTSRLLLTRANYKDSGNYTCVATQTLDTSASQNFSAIKPDSVSVRVL